MKKNILYIFIIFVFLILSAGEFFAMSIFHDDFQSNYKELFKNVEKLNLYTRTHQAELTRAEIEDVDIDGAEFFGAKFNRVVWENTKLEKSTFVKVTFDSCKFTNSSLDDSKFVDCNFVDCDFVESSICASFLEGCKFINCSLENSFMNQWKGDEVTFSEGKILDTPLAQGNIGFSFKNTDMDGVRVMMTEGMHPLTVEGGVLSEVDFGKSHFSDVILRRVQQGEGPTRFNSVRAESFLFEDVEMTRGVSLAHVQSPLVKIVGGTFRGATEGSTIGKVYASNAHLFMYDMSEATMPYVSIDDCDIQELSMWECYAKELSMTNSRVSGIDATDFKADTVVWDNVTLNGKIDFTNAQVKDFQATRLKRGPQLQLITTGSNLKF